MNKKIDGKMVSQKLKEEIKKEIEILKTAPKLVVIQVGNDPASSVYVKNKEKAAISVGMAFEHIKFEDNVLEEEIIKKIDMLNHDDNVDGIIVQLPLPKTLDSYKIVNSISYLKDVDGLTDINMGRLLNNKPYLTPCTPTGIIFLLKAYNVDLSGKNIVVIGRSTLVGKPLIHLLLNENATVTICHSKTENLKEMTKQADILIVAIGKPKYITADMVKEGSVIIDVGINKYNDKMCGDVDFESVSNKVSLITPVPGGVGPMTVAFLLKNTLTSYYRKIKKEEQN